MKKLTIILLTLVNSIAAQAQFSFEVYAGAQHNKIKETKHVLKHSGHFLFINYPHPGNGFQLGIRPKLKLRNYVAISNETELGFQNLIYKDYQGNSETLLKSNFLNTGLMVGVLPFAMQKGIHKTVEVKSGIFLSYSFNNSDWLNHLFEMPQYNYSFRHALAWRYRAFSTQVYMDFMQTPLLNITVPTEEAEFIFHYQSYGFQISYRLTR